MKQTFSNLYGVEYHHIATLVNCHSFSSVANCDHGKQLVYRLSLFSLPKVSSYVCRVSSFHHTSACALSTWFSFPFNLLTPLFQRCFWNTSLFQISVKLLSASNMSFLVSSTHFIVALSFWHHCKELFCQSTCQIVLSI